MNTNENQGVILPTTEESSNQSSEQLIRHKVTDLLPSLTQLREAMQLSSSHQLNGHQFNGFQSRAQPNQQWMDASWSIHRRCKFGNPTQWRWPICFWASPKQWVGLDFSGSQTRIEPGGSRDESLPRFATRFLFFFFGRMQPGFLPFAFPAVGDRPEPGNPLYTSPADGAGITAYRPSTRRIGPLHFLGKGFPASLRNKGPFPTDEQMQRHRRKCNQLVRTWIGNCLAPEVAARLPPTEDSKAM